MCVFLIVYLSPSPSVRIYMVCACFYSPCMFSIRLLYTHRRKCFVLKMCKNEQMKQLYNKFNEFDARKPKFDDMIFFFMSLSFFVFILDFSIRFLFIAVTFFFLLNENWFYTTYDFLLVFFCVYYLILQSVSFVRLPQFLNPKKWDKINLLLNVRKK